ncbi:MAG: peptidyl-alpha-hydroxyglycine alpha-amidating lyase family protein [Gammaproteobacteria bacterium]
MTAKVLSPWLTMAAIVVWALPVTVGAQSPADGAVVDNRAAPLIPFEAVDFIQLKRGQNLGEVLGVAVNSKGNVVILNHPGSATTGPLYGNASTEILEFDRNGKFIREIGHGVYALGYSHSARFDRYDNLWVVDKGTDSVIKFDPSGKAVMNLGRRPEGFDSGHQEHLKQADAVPVDGWFRAPTDVAWDADDNIFVSDGYVNSRIAKLTKEGDWIRSWGKYGRGGRNADENPSSIDNPHSMQVDREGNVYVADRGNRRIQVFDRDGNFRRFLFLNAPYDKARHPTLGNVPAAPDTRPDQTAPWALCISPTTPQYLFAADAEPGRLYKMTLDGKILGVLGESGRRLGQFNWPHAIACPEENTIFVADMNNWRVQKLTLNPKDHGR